MLKFRIDAYAWIPQAEVPNPISALPGGVARWGKGACGPFFGGDNLDVPPASPAAWRTQTYRAKQTFEFHVSAFGASPVIVTNPGVKPGTTIVLTAKRAARGTVCHSVTATVKTSKAEVEWNKADNWYEVRMHGAAQDPVPAAVGLQTVGSTGAVAASALTPNLEWDLTIRFQTGLSIPTATRLRYALSGGFSLDAAATTFPTPLNFGGTANLVHGTIMVRRYPSYIVYGTIDDGSQKATTVPIYFADASDRSLLAIGVGQTDPLRRLTW